MYKNCQKMAKYEKSMQKTPVAKCKRTFKNIEAIIIAK